MRLLVVGLDPTVLDPESPSAQRQLTYFAGADVDIFEMVPGAERHVTLGPTVRSHAAGGSSRLRVAWSTLLSVRRLLRAGTVDVITVQEPFACGLVAYLARLGTTTRLHIQDHSAMFARPHVGWKNRLRNIVARFIVREADRVRTVSARGRRGLEEIGIPSDRIDVVPVPTNVAAFQTVTHVSADHPRLFTVARLFREKGVDILLRSLVEILKKQPNVKLTVVGDGPEREVLGHLAKGLGVASSVSFLGTKNADEIRRQLERTDVYVQPSRFEGWGIAVIEAAAAGVPVVMTDVGCAGEVIVDGRSGRVVPPENPERLADTVVAAIEHRDESMKMAEEAKRIVDALPTVAESTSRIRASLELTASSKKIPSPVLRLFLAALAIRFVLFLAIRVFVGSKGFELGDSIQYLGLAKSLLAGEGFMLNGEPFFFRTVGYPLILAAWLGAFRSITAFAFFQIVLSSFIPLLVLRLGRQLRLGKRATWIAAWLAALEPHLVFYAPMIMTETIYTILLLLGISWTFAAIETKRVGDSVRAGTVFGIGMLLKPLLQLFPPVLLVLSLPWWKRINWRETLKHGLIICTVAGAFLVPWMVRNQITFGKFALSSQGSAAALHYLGSSIVSVRDQIPYREAELRVRETFVDEYGSLTGAEQEAAERQSAMGYVRQHPAIVLRIIVINTITFWTSSNYNSFLNYYHLIPRIDHSVLPPTHYLAQGRIGDFFASFWKIFSQPFYAIGVFGRLVWLVITILFALGVVAAYRRIPDRRLHIVFLMALCAYMTAVIWVDGLGIEARLRFPIMPIEFLFAAYGWTVLRKKSSTVKKLLVITQRVDANDTNLSVHLRWLTEFAKLSESVTVIAQSVGSHVLPPNVRVFSLGKERGASKLKQFFTLQKLIWREGRTCDALLVLMVPLYVLMAAPFSCVYGKPMSLWYTHKRVSLTLRTAVLFVHRAFSASKESFRLQTSKVRFLGHAIDTEFFSPGPSVAREKGKIVTVGRIASVKRIELIVDAVKKLREEGRDVRLEVIGTPLLPADQEYEKILRGIAGDFVTFSGGKSSAEVRGAYRSASVCVNASATGSLDKAILEAMACGCPVVTSNEAFASIVPSESFVRDASALVSSIRSQLDRPSVESDLRARVTEHHKLRSTLSSLFSQLV